MPNRFAMVIAPAEVRSMNTLVIQQAEQFVVTRSSSDFVFKVAAKRKKASPPGSSRILRDSPICAPPSPWGQGPIDGPGSYLSTCPSIQDTPPNCRWAFSCHAAYSRRGRQRAFSTCTPGLMRIAGEDMGAAVGVDVAAYYSILGPEGSSAQSGRLEHALYSTHGLSLEARG